jgi:hypothetical protein
MWAKSRWWINHTHYVIKKKSKKDKLVVNLKKHLCRLKNQQANAYLLTILKPNIFEDVNDIELSKF